VKNSAIKLSGVTLGLMMAGAVHADTFNATASVSSTITLVETTALDLGTLFIPTQIVACDGANANLSSFFTVETDGSAGSVTAGIGNCNTTDMVSLSSETPGLVTVTGASPFGSVTIDSNTASTPMVHSSGNPSLPNITVTIVTLPADGASLTLDANGDGGIIVGGDFGPELGTSNVTAFADGVYTGTYDIDVSY